MDIADASVPFTSINIRTQDVVIADKLNFLFSVLGNEDVPKNNFPPFDCALPKYNTLKMRDSMVELKKVNLKMYDAIEDLDTKYASLVKIYNSNKAKLAFRS